MNYLVGSIEPVTQSMWVFNDETKKMESRKITYVSATFGLCCCIVRPRSTHYIVYGQFNIYLGAWSLQDL